jgi:hypothetical protein
MNQDFDHDESLRTRLATVCLVVGFCVGLGLGVSALSAYTETRDKTPG